MLSNVQRKTKNRINMKKAKEEGGQSTNNYPANKLKF
jgi:hypothetical protein